MKSLPLVSFLAGTLAVGFGCAEFDANDDPALSTAHSEQGAAASRNSQKLLRLVSADAGSRSGLVRRAYDGSLASSYRSARSSKRNWIRFDLGATKRIDRIHLYVKGQGNRHLKIVVDKKLRWSGLLQRNAWTDIELSNVRGRRVKIDGQQSLRIAEVQVYGSGGGVRLRKGMGVWVYAFSKVGQGKAIDYIKGFNANVREDKKIRYVYVSGGGVESYNDNYNGKYNAVFLYDSIDFARYRKSLPGVEIHVMLEGDTATANNLGKLSAAKLEKMARDIAALADNNPSIDGVHFDIEPFRSGQGELVRYTQKHLEKPLGASLGSFTDDGFFGHLDIPVIMNYDQCVSGLSGFAKVTRRRAEQFFGLCKKYENPNCHYGLAAVKTYCEPASLDYYKASYEVFQDFEDQSLGLTIYGIFTPGPMPDRRFMDLLKKDYYDGRAGSGKEHVPCHRLQRALQRGQAQDSQALTGDGVLCQPASLPDRHGGVLRSPLLGAPVRGPRSRGSVAAGHGE